MGDCCFYKRLLPKTLNKKQQAPKLPKHPPKRTGFDNFLDPHFKAFCRTVCKFAPQRGTKMASKMTPLCDSMALMGPSRGPPWETPEGLGPSRGPCMRGYTHHVWLLRPVGPGLHDNACNPHPCSSVTPPWTRSFRVLLLFPSLSTTGVPRAHPSETICRRVLLFPSLSTTGVWRAHPS